MKYSAEDFENAKFAEHPETEALAVHLAPTGWEADYGWTVIDSEGFCGHIDAQGLADHGWVPVPTKPTIKMSDYKRAVLEGDSFTERLEMLGIEIIPDPEPTNTDRLAEHLSQIVEDEKLEIGSAVVTFIANELNQRNVTVKGS